MILDGVKDKYEEYHEIYFLDEAIESAIELSVQVSSPIDIYQISLIGH